MDNEIACNNTDNKLAKDVEQLQDQHKGNNVENDQLGRQAGCQSISVIISFHNMGTETNTNTKIFKILYYI